MRPNPSDYGKPYSTIGGGVATIGLIVLIITISALVCAFMLWAKG